jgi:hypothetical protein
MRIIETVVNANHLLKLHIIILEILLIFQQLRKYSTENVHHLYVYLFSESSAGFQLEILLHYSLF